MASLKRQCMHDEAVDDGVDDCESEDVEVCCDDDDDEGDRGVGDGDDTCATCLQVHPRCICCCCTSASIIC